MAESLPIVNTSIDTFGVWVSKVNSIILLANTDMVSANSTGGITNGKGYVNGSFGSNTLVTSTLAGGNLSTTANLTVSTNVNFTGNTIWVGNSSVNTSLISTAITTSSLVANLLTVGSSVVNTTSISAVTLVGNVAASLITSGTINNSRLNTGNVTAVGIVQLLDSVSNTSDSHAATPNAVATAYNAAITAYSNAVIFASNASTMNTGIVNSSLIVGSYANITAIGNLVNLNVSSNVTMTTLVGLGTSSTLSINVAGSANIGANVAIGNNLTVAGSLTVTGDLVYTGVASGSYIPISNAYFLGNTISRWSLNAMTGDFAANVNMSQNLTVTGNASVTGNVSTAGLSVTTAISYGPNSDVQMRSLTTTTTGATAAIIDTFTMATYRTAKYIIQVHDNNANNKYASEIMLSHDDTVCYITEFGSITTNTSVGSFTSNAYGGVAQLVFTPSSTNTSVKLIRTLITS